MITLYGLTNERSKDIDNCFMFLENPYDVKSLVTFSPKYYKISTFQTKGSYGPVPSLTDFQYILKIVIKPDNLFIIKSKKDIIPNMFAKTHLGLDAIKKHVGHEIDGVILYRLKGLPYDSYRPYLYITNKDCIVNVSIAYKQTPLQRPWISVEDCKKFDKLQCLNSQSCVVTTNKGIKGIVKKQGCRKDEQLQRLAFPQLEKMMLPYKYYSFANHKQAVHNVNMYPSDWFKPNGFWFAEGSQWLQYLQIEHWTERIDGYNYLYEVELDMDEVLLISTLKQLHEFTKKFCTKSNCLNLDWKSIVKKINKSGLVIAPNLKYIIWMFKNSDEAFDFNDNQGEYFKGNEWYLAWDIASGVVWNTKAIKSLQLIYEKKPGKFVRYRKPRS